MRVLIPSIALVMMWGAGHLLAAVSPQALPCTNNFDQYVSGTKVNTLTSEGWTASADGVVVQSGTVSPVTPNVNAVLLPERTVVSNVLNGGVAASNVWFDSEVVMARDQDQDPPPVNSNAVVLATLGADGYLQLYDRDLGQWRSLSNDIAMAAVPVLTNGQWAKVTIHQNYATHQCAVLLNGRALVDRVPFVSNVNQCTTFRMVGAEYVSSYLDDYGMTLAAPGGLEQDANNNGMADGLELQTYGYLGKSFVVGVGQSFTNIQDALGAALVNDAIVVADAGPYEAVTINHAVRDITGASFTVNGVISLATGLSVTSQVGFSCSDLAVSNGATLVVSGIVSAVHLVLEAGARLVITNGSLTADGVTLEGSFTVDSTWGTQVSRELPFSDDFEQYADGTPLMSLGFRGWAASSSDILVQSATTYGGSARAVELNYYEMISNRVNGAGAASVWTDFRGIMAYGALDETPTANPDAVALVYLNPQGYLTIRNNGVWDVCSNDVWQMAVQAITNGQWIHVSINNDFTRKDTALVLNGRVLRGQVPFVNMAATRYSSLRVVNDHINAAYLDNVLIQQQLPVSLAGTDAATIATYGTAVRGSIFTYK